MGPHTVCMHVPEVESCFEVHNLLLLQWLLGYFRFAVPT